MHWMILSGFFMSSLFFGLGGWIYFKEKNKLGLVAIALGVIYASIWTAIYIQGT